MKKYLRISIAVSLLLVVGVCMAQGIVDTSKLVKGGEEWALGVKNIMLIAYGIGMIVYRIVPTNGKWEWLAWPLKILDIIIPNYDKSGSKHKV